MADQPRRGRKRPDSKQMWEESDRRNRHGPGPRDRWDDRERHREDGPRDRDRRFRSRSRSPRRDRRDKNRSRSRDRRDRDRDQDRNRPREPDRTRGKDDGRRRDKGRDGRRDDDREPRPVKDGIIRDRHSNPRRSASPPRSPSKLERSAHNSPLPTRSKPSEKGSAASLSFKVGKSEDDPSRGGNAKGKGHGAHDTPEYEDRRAGSSSFDEERKDTPEAEGDPMDEDDDIIEADDEMSAMQAMMGFGGFGTTKGSKVVGNNVGAVRKAKKTEYRQYMNRVGGFNRPLSPSR
ncbi:hypothetical protein F5X99DRAFT_52365 [Biscogniauxia marginata]|nr:hypothetical protein F5X99DRAFT_52365 [Biscogniauxia marginata]